MSEKIGYKIKEIRDSYNLSQDRFARRLGVSGKTISAYETGRTNPPIKVLQKIVTTYKTPIVNLNEELKRELSKKLDVLENEVVSLKGILKDSLSL
jgi:transcriptional regulator with XRE-family HTH domain